MTRLLCMRAGLQADVLALEQCHAESQKQLDALLQQRAAVSDELSSAYAELEHITQQALPQPALASLQPLNALEIAQCDVSVQTVGVFTVACDVSVQPSLTAEKVAVNAVAAGLNVSPDRHIHSDDKILEEFQNLLTGPGVRLHHLQLVSYTKQPARGWILCQTQSRLLVVLCDLRFCAHRREVVLRPCIVRRMHLHDSRDRHASRVSRLTWDATAARLRPCRSLTPMKRC
jgi:hypothetical protein